uniref:1-acyl-sn-glycerol-3-phosphate acyltransferase n=1 Tax=Acrobeloides nanus TaxID=290746 RepID=A0A914EAT5_9BILA
MLAESLNVSWWLPWLIFLLIQIPLLYSISETARYYIRMILYGFTIIVAGFCAIPVSIPSYFLNKGGLWAFYVFNRMVSWVDVNIEIRGKEILESVEGPAVLISNHQSSIDVITMGRCWPDRCAVMMKSTLKWVPGFNICVALCNTIFVSRFDKKDAHAAVVQASDAIQEKGLKIWVFPEGTRHREHGFKQFKKGAFNIAVHAQIPIIPLVISDYSPFYSKEKKFFRWPGHVIVQVLKPVSTQGLTYDDVPELTEKIRNQMLEEYEKISKEAALLHGPKIQINGEAKKE